MADQDCNEHAARATAAKRLLIVTGYYVAANVAGMMLCARGFFFPHSFSVLGLFVVAPVLFSMIVACAHFSKERGRFDRLGLAFFLFLMFCAIGINLYFLAQASAAV